MRRFPVPEVVRKFVVEEQWNEVDETFQQLVSRGGEIFELLREYHDFSQIELMISIRDAQNEWEDDGIWHDDGSRVLAFSLSLTIDADTIEGGSVEIRRKGEEHSKLVATPPCGTAILFLTGVHGYEHRTRKVIRGKRVILVGWCS